MSAEEGKLVFRRYLEEFHSQRQLELADEILGPELREPTLGLARMLQMAFPDFHIRVLDQVAEGDQVATVWEAQGTHEGNGRARLGRSQQPGSISGGAARRRCAFPMGRWST